MKLLSSRVALLASALVVLTFAGTSHANAQVYVDVRIGPTAPPPPVVERPWHAPYRGAVWIPGSYEWVHGRYVWRGGYYSYPPRRGGYWVAPRYVNRGGVYYYRPGRWAY